MRESQMRKIPVTLILGDDEKEGNYISYRLFGSRETTRVEMAEFIDFLRK